MYEVGIPPPHNWYNHHALVESINNNNILIVSNDKRNLGIKVISWSWLVGDVTKILDFSDHI